MKTIFTFLLLSLLAATAQSQPFRTPTFTGDAATDFKADEKNAAAGVSYCFTWDATYMYFGVTGPGTYIKLEPTLVYLDSDPAIPARTGTGDSTGFNYDNRIVALPFSANFVLYFKSGYAELRTSTAGTWSSQTVATTQITTGTNDIEIRIPWAALPGGVRPASMSALFFKTNGNGSQTDAYEVKPGVTAVDSSYTSDVAVNGPKIFYGIQNTSTGFYHANNLFSWVTNSTYNYCNTSTSSSTTNITATTAKFNWTAVPGALRYQVFARKNGTGAWLNGYLPGNKTSYSVTGLVCNTNYQWMVRTNCDTAQGVDINSAFTAIKTFKTSACAAIQEGINEQVANAVLLYPSPVKKGGVLQVKTKLPVGDAKYSIYSLTGILLQQGNISGPVRLGSKITPGLYMLTVTGGALPLHTQLQVTE